MKDSLITHLTPLISIFADKYQYILIIKSNPTQELKNADHSYHYTIAGCFEEILSYATKLNLADDKDKTMKEVANIVENTVQEIRALFKPFEDLVLSKNASTAQIEPEYEGSNEIEDIFPISA